MSEPLSAAALANVATSFAPAMAGALALLLTRLMAPQPRRWRFVYAAVMLTGPAEVWRHGFGGVAAYAGYIASLFLLAWSVQWAVLGDFWPGRIQRIAGSMSGALCLAAVIARILRRDDLDHFTGRYGSQFSVAFMIPVGPLGAFTLGEALVIGNLLLTGALLYSRLRLVPPRARPLLHAVAAICCAGLLLAARPTTEVALQILPWHALWHIWAGVGAMALWAFNQARFSEDAPLPHSASVLEIRAIRGIRGRKNCL